MNDLRMELKVCEGCGALWLRTANMAALGPVTLDHAHPAGVYCRRCIRSFAQFPASRVARGRRPARVRVRNNRPLATVTANAIVVGGAR